MKKLLTVFFALALVAAFAMPAAAVDVSVKGEYFITGNYEDNPTMQSGDQTGSASSQWSHQRFRPEIDFKVQEGLKLVVRMDIMERYWGQGNISSKGTAAVAAASDTPKVTETSETNIEFDRVYIVANVGPGVLQAGHLETDYALSFGNYYGSGPRVKYTVPFGKFTADFWWTKVTEGDIGTTDSAKDRDEYAVGLMYKLDKGFIGLFDVYTYDQSNAANDRTTSGHDFKPYFKYAFGDVTVQFEGSILFMETDYDAAGTQDVDQDGMAFWLAVDWQKGDFGVGGQYYYCEGDDPNTNDNEGGGTMGLSPLGTFIMYNYWTNKFNGVNSAGTMAANSWGYGMTNNISAIEVHASYKVMPKLTIKALYAYADTLEKVSGHMEEPYGSEFDLSATYKIYDNLQYMVGFGYLWAGDYWKSSASDNTVDDDYIVLNQLTLKF